MHNLPHVMPSAHAVTIGASDPGAVIQTILVLQRRPGHDPIPTFDDYVNCPPRVRHTPDNFAVKYGASVIEAEAVRQHYADLGFEAEVHLARRHVMLKGTVAQHNAAFGVTLQEFSKQHGKHVMAFRHHLTPAQVPPQFEEIILEVLKLDTEIHAFASTDHPAVTGQLTPDTLAKIYNAPTTAGTGQTIAVISFSVGGSFSSTDLTTSCKTWGITVPSVKTIVLDTVTFASSAELQMDVSLCAAFGGGADIVIYQGTSYSEMIARIAHPQAGEAQCSIITISYAETEFSHSRTETVFEDAAIQGITVFAATGDWGITAATGTISPCYPAISPYVTGVGGTVVGALSGTVSSTNFVEWAWNEQQLYYNVTGGGVSVVFPKPSYQGSVTLPATLTTTAGTLPAGTTGRGIPDISANADSLSGMVFTWTGTNALTNGTSASTPTMAGMFARVNAALGSNVGLINPTLYNSTANTNFIRKLNTGGPANNTMINQNSGTNPGVTFTGYPSSTTGWNACVGLGMLDVGKFQSWVKTNGLTGTGLPAELGKNYWLKITDTNDFGSTNSVLGPYFVKTVAPF